MMMMAGSNTNTSFVSENFPINRFLRSLIESLRQEWISECSELCHILEQVHVRTLCTVVDRIARQIYDLDDDDDDNTDDDDSFQQQLVPVPVAGKKRKRLSADYGHHQRPRRRRPKTINVIKSNEPLGVTVRFDDRTGDVILARILVGGAAYRSGLVHLGDRILEVNGIVLRGRSHLDAINVLQRECRKTVVTFKIDVGGMAAADDLATDVRNLPYMVKAHFDYDPRQDPDIPCAQIGLAFENGAILNVLNRDDPDGWWQASKEITAVAAVAVGGQRKSRMEIFQIAGLIPSPWRQERRMVAERNLLMGDHRRRRVRLFGGLVPLPVTKTKWAGQKIKKIMYDLRDCIQYDREEICAYEPVARYFPRPGHCRPIVLVAADGIGVPQIIQQLCSHGNETRYREPLMHTSRYRRFQENDGIDYYFVDEPWMENEIEAGHFVCYTKHRGNYYGVHQDTIRQIIETGFICLLSIPGRFLRLIHRAEFKPYVIFIRPVYDVQRWMESRIRWTAAAIQQSPQTRRQWLLHQYEMAHLMIYESHKLQILYGHKFDSVVIVSPPDAADPDGALEEATETVRQIIETVENHPTWVPVTWINHKSVDRI